MYQERVNRILEKLNKLGVSRVKTIDYEEVLEIEKEYNVKFPESYVVYLTQIQNGGSSDELHSKGPYYGIYSLEQSISENKEWEVEIAKPFNFTDDFEFEDICDSEPDIIEKYQNTSVLQGTIPICQYGCGDYFRMIVTGEKSGEIWADCGIINQTGYYSLKVDILTFYENWLDRKILIQTDTDKRLINAWYPFLEFGNNKKYKIVK